MEYIQLTLEDYEQSKNEIKENLGGIVKSFVRIGWQLTRINATRAYQMDGYKSIAEFARSEYGMTPDGVSRFMNVYEKYSLPGDTPELQERYRDYKFAQLTEMLKLPEEDQAMIEPEAQRESIRELKRFNKENENNPDNLFAWQQEPVSKITETITEFYRTNRELTEELLSSTAYQEKNLKELSEMINPSGNRSFKKGTVFLMLYGIEKGIMIKEFGQGTKTISWEEFIQMTESIFRGQSYAEKFNVSENPPASVNTVSDNDSEEKEKTEVTEQKHRNEIVNTPEKVQKPKESIQEQPEEVPENPEKYPAPAENIREQSGTTAESKEQKEEIAPAQEKTAETLSAEEFPKVQEEPEKEVEETAEVIERPFGSRKEYLNSLSEIEAAAYMHRAMIMEKGPENIRSMIAWQKWFEQKVDQNGQEV